MSSTFFIFPKISSLKSTNSLVSLTMRGCLQAPSFYLRGKQLWVTGFFFRKQHQTFSPAWYEKTRRISWGRASLFRRNKHQDEIDKEHRRGRARTTGNVAPALPLPWLVFFSPPYARLAINKRFPPSEDFKSPGLASKIYSRRRKVYTLTKFERERSRGLFGTINLRRILHTLVYFTRGQHFDLSKLSRANKHPEMRNAFLAPWVKFPPPLTPFFTLFISTKASRLWIRAAEEISVRACKPSFRSGWINRWSVWSFRRVSPCFLIKRLKFFGLWIETWKIILLCKRWFI